MAQSARIALRPPSLRPEVAFPVRLVTLGVVAFGVFGLTDPSYRPLQDATAALVARIGHLLGMEAVQEPGSLVRFGDESDGFRFFVSNECTALAVAVTYLVAVVAYPTHWRARLWGLAIGLPALYALNIARLLLLGLVGLHAREHFDAAHAYWWQALFVTGVGLLWFAWAWCTGGTSRTTADATGRRVAAGVLVVPFAVIIALVILAVVGAAGGVTAYGRFLQVPQAALVRAVWGDTLQLGPPTGSLYAADYALTVAVVVLFMAAPGLDRSARTRGALTRGVPIAVLVQVLVPVAALALGTPGDTAFARGSAAAGLAVHAGASLVVWHTWLRRARGVDDRD
jgi:exosortase/archaeosortase family protein